MVPPIKPRFRIYYADGSVWDGLPEDAPGTNVIAIVEPDPVAGRVVLFGRTVYCWHKDEGLWYGHDSHGWTLCATGPGWRKVAFGVTIPTERFMEIRRAALNDPDFPPESGARPETRAD